MQASPAIPEIGFVERFDLNSEIQALESRKPWPQGMTSKLLLKTDNLRILMIAMESGAKMKEHHNDGRISIHVVRGSIRVRVEGKVEELSSQQLLVLDKSIMHDVEALQSSVLVLTIAWPTDEELIGIEHRGYGS